MDSNDKCKTIDEIIKNILDGDGNKAITKLEYLRENINNIMKENERLLVFIEKLGGKDGKNM